MSKRLEVRCVTRRIQDTERIDQTEVLSILGLSFLRDDAAERHDRNLFGTPGFDRAQRVLDRERSLTVTDEAVNARNGLEDCMNIVGTSAAVQEHRSARRSHLPSGGAQRELLAHHGKRRSEGG